VYGQALDDGRLACGEIHGGDGDGAGERGDGIIDDVATAAGSTGGHDVSEDGGAVPRYSEMMRIVSAV
jgi:hypothetical protein